MKTSTKFFRIGVIAALCGLAVWPAYAYQTEPITQTTSKTECFVRIDSIGTNQDSIDVIDVNKENENHADYVKEKISPIHIQVSDAGLQSKVKSFNRGDYVSVTFKEAQKKETNTVERTLEAVTVRVAMVSSWNRFVVLFFTAVLYILLCWLLTGCKSGPRAMIKGEDGRYSNSKFQIFIWFGVVFTTYVTTVLFRSWDFGIAYWQVGIPPNLLLLSGLSALTFAAAKGITTAKVNDLQPGQTNPKDPASATAAVITSPPTTAPAAQPAPLGQGLLSDLTHDDYNKVDIGDFQMLVVTLIAVVTYLFIAFNFLGALEWRAGTMLPDVDTTILATFGLGQGAYLTKKALGEVGT